MPKTKFTKPALTIDQQLAFLIQQGLQVNNPKFAKHILSTVSYYRLSGYLLPFKQNHCQGSPRQFNISCTFEDIWQLYQFDRELRLLVSDAIERIEVAFRAAFVNVTSTTWDPFWYCEKQYYKNEAFFDLIFKNIESVARDKQEVFIKHYYEQYNAPPFPPLWMMVEALSFGLCSKLYSNIKSIAVRNNIAAVLGQHTTVIESWLRSLTYVRNLCAHHARLWNRWFINAPLIPKNELNKTYFFTERNYKFHLIAYVITKLLQKITPETDWKSELRALFLKYKNFPGKEMGFKEEWEEESFWTL